MNKKEKLIKELFWWVRSVGIGAICIFILQNTLIVNALVTSSSMENTVMTGSRIMGSRIAYLMSEPERFDIILFMPPDEDSAIPYLKRIIGLPNEKVEIKDGKVYIDDSAIPLDDSFIMEKARGNFGPFSVPDGCYFVMGDNRNYSYDSKNWKNKYVSKDRILGKVYFEYFPIPQLLD